MSPGWATESWPDVIDVVTVDLAYLAVADLVPQLEGLRLGDGADRVAVVKPMYELGLPMPPTDRAVLGHAVDRATAALANGRWRVLGAIESPVRGSGGAVEFLVHARR